MQNGTKSTFISLYNQCVPKVAEKTQASKYSLARATISLTCTFGYKLKLNERIHISEIYILFLFDSKNGNDGIMV